MHAIELPRRFYEDHIDRMSDKNPEEPAYSDVALKWKKNTVVVQACDEALAEIESDADYYACQVAGESMEKEYFGLIMSAKATLRRIKAYRDQLFSEAAKNGR